MDYVSPNDFYEIRVASLVSNVDKDVLVELYQPLIGASATMVYLTLLKQNRNAEAEELYKIETLLNITQFAPGMILSARHMLEAVGLLRTYENINESGRYYIYVLYAPKSPKDFFDDVLFKGLLIQYVGEKEAKRLAFKYKINLAVDEKYHEISASFVDVFHPNYDDASFKKEFGNSILGHEPGRVKIIFNYDLFFKYIGENSQILPSSFFKKDMKEIERLATLFGLDEKQMASIVIDEYNPYNTPHLDYAKVTERAEDAVKYKVSTDKPIKTKSQVNGKSILNEKIIMMDEVSPAFYLRVTQGNTKPAKADLNILDSLSANYGLPNGVINAIIDYALTKNNNVLSKNYCEKIAATIKRMKIETTIDAMNYLYKVQNDNRKPVTKPIEKKTPVEETTKKPIEVVSDEEINDILNMIEQRKKGGKN